MEKFGESFRNILLPIIVSSTIAGCSLAFGEGKSVDAKPNNEITEKLRQPFSLEEIIAKIDCSIRMTLDDEKELTDLQLLQVLKCSEIKKIEFEIVGEKNMSLTVFWQMKRK